MTLCYPLFQGLKKVKAQGFGANTDEEMDQYGKNDMRALSEMLGNKVITVMGDCAMRSLSRKFGPRSFLFLTALCSRMLSSPVYFLHKTGR
jgi:hypothetical protein